MTVPFALMDALEVIRILRATRILGASTLINSAFLLHSSDLLPIINGRTYIHVCVLALCRTRYARHVTAIVLLESTARTDAEFRQVRDSVEVAITR